MKFKRLWMLLEAHTDSEDEFVRHHYTGGIPSNAYDRTTAPGGMGYYKIEDYPVVVGTLKLKTPVDQMAGETEGGKPFREVWELMQKVKGEIKDIPYHVSKSYPEWYKDVWFNYKEKHFTFRATEDEIKEDKDVRSFMLSKILHDYYKMDNYGHYTERMKAPPAADDLTITLRKTGTKVKYTDGSEKEDPGIVAFHGDNPVGAASDEFGAVGIYVATNYQKQGLGTELLHRYMEQFKDRPDKKLGQMTQAGYNLTKSWYRNKIKPKP